MSFLASTGLRARGVGDYAATLEPGWASMIGIHGGYVVSLAARAIEQSIDDGTRPLRSVTAQFVRPPQPGDVGIGVEIVRSGRSVTFARATVHQDDRTVMTVSAVGASRRAGLGFDELPRPAGVGAAPGEARRFTGPVPGEHFEQLDLRLEPGLRLHGGSGVARVAGWMRPLDPDEPVSVAWLLCAADVMPPSIEFRTDGPVKAASVELCVQVVRGDPDALVPPGGHVFGEMRSSISAEGYNVEDGTFWAPGGEVLATSRQLRLSAM